MSATIERLPTKPRPRPVDDETPTIAEAVPAAIRDIADRAAIKPNVRAMHDAIDRWIKEANTRGGQAGIDYLVMSAARIQSNRENLAAHVLNNERLRPGMEGLTVWDLDAADLRVTRAVRQLSGEPS